VGVVPILRVKNARRPLEPGGQASPVCTMAAEWSPHAYRQQVLLRFCGSEYSNPIVRMIRKRNGDMNHDKLV
jgi:hypothetical protein